MADGELQLHLSWDSATTLPGAQPDLLRPALQTAGAIAPEDTINDLLDEDEGLPPAEQKRRALQAVGEHFGLTLPQQVIENGQLPVVVTRAAPPSSW
ncbi:hypothetical protein [Streptomyces olivaceus]|uniref:hypothetical protein n=1 Tax=Streptomyces olivaceus TaxID=47716 RepID=UPI0040576870